MKHQSQEPKHCDKSSKLRKGMIIGLGNSMLDLVAHVDSTVLNSYNLTPNNGHLATTAHGTLFKELIDKYKAKYVVGGSVLSSLRVTQWVLDEPEVCIIYGAIGCDEQGEQLASKAKADGVDTQFQYVEDKPTGVCAVLLTKNGAERTLVANLSACTCFTTDHFLKPQNQEKLQNADIIYVSGFFLAVNVGAILHAAQIANESKQYFSMNLSAAYVAEQFMAEWARVMPYVDIVFGNDVEARTFAKEKGFEEVSDIHKIALELSNLPNIRKDQQRTVVITQGSDPVIVVKGGLLREYPVPSLTPEQVVDTTGAGDAFVGGFLAQLVLGAPTEECVRCGIWCASQMVQQQGCCHLEGLMKYNAL